jgi:transposase
MANILSPDQIRQIKRLVAQGCRSRDIARHLGISESSVHKARQGRFDHRLRDTPSADESENQIAVWCQRCRCHVYLPCQVCRLQEYQRRQARRGAQRHTIPLPKDIRDREILRRLQLSVAEIGLPLRVVNYLQYRNILTVNDLLHCQREELLAMPNFGKITVRRLYRCLQRLGFSPPGDSSEGQLRRAG